ncbi:ComF family protein [Sulfitobacter albidus]|uniref:ComF family protein n=1 Tax=Sulfitobacter albidus TaxID=2829501 RepID=A0A975JGH0_9RHOB|nr:ComF family protein [Sulfitobacter albidus]
MQTAVSLIYPPRCIPCGGLVDSDFGLCAACWRETQFIGITICESCSTPLPPGGHDETLHCDACLQAPPPWVQGRAALVYGGVGRKLVLSLKHGDRQEIARPAGLWMASRMRAGAPDDTLVIPVPLHWRRLLKRRYNQSALLARQTARALGAELCVDALVRRRATQSLDGKSREQRFATLANTIAPHPRNGAVIEGRAVLLVDDVMTSGATLTASTWACLEAGAREVRVVTLARAVKDT